MNEISEETVSKIVGKIYRDTTVTQSKNYFITHKYKSDNFSSLTSPEIFHRLIGFLPNTKYRGKPFILSVVFNKKCKEYEVVVHNPKLTY